MARPERRRASERRRAAIPHAPRPEPAPLCHWHDWIPTEDRLVDYLRDNEESLHLEWARDRGVGGTQRRINGPTGVPLLLPPALLRLLGPGSTRTKCRTRANSRNWSCRGMRAPRPRFTLPRTVSANKIRAGYPLGKTADRYHLCHNSSDTEAVGYYLRRPSSG